MHTALARQHISTSEKKVADLNLDQMAILAGLPKAPSTDNPVSNPTRAKQRRDYVLRRMLELSHISQQDYQQALQQTRYFQNPS